jgi:hypothetical protein
VHETHFVRILEANFPLCVKIFSEYRQEETFSKKNVGVTGFIPYTVDDSCHEC